MPYQFDFGKVLLHALERARAEDLEYEKLREEQRHATAMEGIAQTQATAAQTQAEATRDRVTQEATEWKAKQKQEATSYFTGQFLESNPQLDRLLIAAGLPKDSIPTLTEGQVYQAMQFASPEIRTEIGLAADGSRKFIYRKDLDIAMQAATISAHRAANAATWADKNLAKEKAADLQVVYTNLNSMWLPTEEEIKAKVKRGPGIPRIAPTDTVPTFGAVPTAGPGPSIVVEYPYNENPEVYRLQRKRDLAVIEGILTKGYGKLKPIEILSQQAVVPFLGRFLPYLEDWEKREPKTSGTTIAYYRSLLKTAGLPSTVAELDYLRAALSRDSGRESRTGSLKEGR